MKSQLNTSFKELLKGEVEISNKMYRELGLMGREEEEDDEESKE